MSVAARARLVAAGVGLLGAALLWGCAGPEPEEPPRMCERRCFTIEATSVGPPRWSYRLEDTVGGRILRFELAHDMPPDACEMTGLPQGWRSRWTHRALRASASADAAVATIEFTLHCPDRANGRVYWSVTDDDGNVEGVGPVAGPL